MSEWTDTQADTLMEPPRKRMLLTLRAVSWFVSIGLAIVIGRVVQLQWRPSAELVDHRPHTVSTRTELSSRGDILDCRGRALATSRIGYRLFVDPQEVDDPYTIAIDIARLLNMDPVALDKLVQERLDKRYAVLVPLLTGTQVEIIRTADLKGVGLEPVEVRSRPYGDLAAPLIGKVGTDDKGLTGIEYLQDTELSGENGQLQYLRDRDRTAMWVEQAGYKPSVDGKNVRLTIDIELQRIAEEELSKGLQQYNAGGGRCVILDPRTGNLLAMTDMLRDRTDGIDFAADPARKIDPSLARMRCVTDPYEPGSTFKPFVWTRATELGYAKLDDVIDTHWGAMPVRKGRILHDDWPYKELTWENVLVKSSNIGMATIALRMTFSQLQKCLADFGFGEPTGIGLPGESGGIVTPPKRWTIDSQASVAMGQEIAVTPLQMVRAFSAFCRDGSLPTLHFLTPDEPGAMAGYIVQKPVSDMQAQQTRMVLRQVMLTGTGRRANVGAEYRMFGKSGTAQMPKSKGGGYFKDRYVISFISGAPLDDPRLVVLVVIEDPDRSLGHLGGAVAGPINRDIMNRALEYLGIPSDLDADDANHPHV